MARRSRFSQGVRERAVRMVFDPETETANIVVARDLPPS